MKATINAVWTKVLIVLAVVTTCCHGYADGPPLTACQDMFPTDHGADPQTVEPPFSFTLNATTYYPGDTISVFLNSSGDWFMEGALIQVRSIDCSNYNAYGTFEEEPGDKFLEKFNCFGRSASALRHYAHYHIYNRTFTWTAPAEASGHLYIRATIARNEKTFWTNVYSDYIMDASDSSKDTKRCDPAPVSFAYIMTSSVPVILSLVLNLMVLL